MATLADHSNLASIMRVSAMPTHYVRGIRKDIMAADAVKVSEATVISANVIIKKIFTIKLRI